MNCCAHPSVPATASCQPCGRGLCSRCSVRFTLLRCEACLLKGNAAASHQAYRALAITLILLVVGSWLASSFLLNSPYLPINSPRSVAQSEPKAHMRVHATPGAQTMTSRQGRRQFSSWQAIQGGLMFGCLLICLYWGFSALSQQKRRWVMVGSPMFWCMYLFFRIVAAAFVGVIAAPRKIFCSIRDIQTAKRTLGQLQRGEI